VSRDSEHLCVGATLSVAMLKATPAEEEHAAMRASTPKLIFNED